MLNAKKQGVRKMKSAASKTRRGENKTTFWQAIKKMFGGEFRNKRSCRSVQGTLKTGQSICAGNCTLDAMSGGRLLVRVGGDLTFLIRVEQAREFFVRCWSTGGRVPQLVSSSPEPVAGEKQQLAAGHGPPATTAPLVRLGPGGDYVRDWPRPQAGVCNS